MAQVTIHNENGDIVGVFDSRLLVSASVESEFEHESEDNSLSFTWNAGQVDVDGADTIIMVQNISDDLILHIEDIWFSADVIAQFQIHVINDATTPVGAAIVGTCLNRHSPKLASTHAIAKGDETANTNQGSVIWSRTALAEVGTNVHYGGALILGPGDAVAVDIVEAPTEVNGGISGYFKTT